MIHRTAQCSHVEAQGVQKRQLFSYCNLPVEDHVVVIIKRQISTEQSEEQHPHTPHISLGEKHHLSSVFQREIQRLMLQWIWARKHKPDDLWHTRLTRCFHGQTDAEFVWNKQSLLQKSRPWFAALPLSQCRLSPGWAQEQHMQDFHSMSWAHNPNLPEMRQTDESSKLPGTMFYPLLAHLHSLLWQEIDSRISHNLRLCLCTFGFAHNPKSISFKLWSSSINKFSCRAEKSQKNEWADI